MEEMKNIFRESKFKEL